MSDVVLGKVTPQMANAAVNAGGKLLKVVEMSARYGTSGSGDKRNLDLIPGEPDDSIIGDEYDNDHDEEDGDNCAGARPRKS